jgi:hypothetical protein
VGVGLGRSTDAVVALALGEVVAPPSAPAGLALADGRPAVAVGTGWFDAVAVGAAGVGVGVGVDVDVDVAGLVARVVGDAVGDALADGNDAGPSRTGDGTGRGRVLELVLAPGGPAGEIG